MHLVGASAGAAGAADGYPVGVPVAGVAAQRVLAGAARRQQQVEVGAGLPAGERGAVRGRQPQGHDSVGRVLAGGDHEGEEAGAARAGAVCGARRR
ncbi:hypothetical protein ACFQ60_07930 [Streptomyces zhihengii]